MSDDPTTTERGALVSELMERYRSFERPAPPGRPWVTANMVVSIDGKVTLEGRVGELGTGPDREVFAAIRAHADAVLVGAGTVRAERYGPIRVSASHAEQRVLAGRDTTAPPLVVITNTADLDWRGAYVIAPETPTIVVLPEDRSSHIPEEAPVEVLHAPGPPIDLRGALALLRDRGFTHVVTEGGPTLLARLIDGGLLDELCVTVAPVLAGRAGAELGLVRSLEHTRRLELVDATAVAGDVFLRYRVELT